MKNFFGKNIKYLIIGVLFIAIVVVVIIFVKRGGTGSEGSDQGVEIEAPEQSKIPVPKDKYEVNAYPEVNNLLSSYFDAVSAGDADTVASLSSSLSDEEKMRIQVQAKYYDGFSNYNVYTKAGPAEHSYFAFATYDMKFAGIDTLVPAIASVYVCTNDVGQLYVNKNEPTEDEKVYFQTIAVQQDVENLYSDVEVKYNAAVEKDSALTALMPTIKSQINQEVKEALAAQQQADAEAQAQEEAAAKAAAEAAAATTVRVTELVNIRASASQEADSLGKASAGMEFTRYEVMDNGWSRIDYNGTDAYIKSDYLEEVVQEVADENAIGASGKVTVKENVNIRETASETGNKLGVAFRGETFDYVGMSEGWVQIKYDGQDAYIKAEFVD